ncbi:MAG: metallophosphoesterase [Clostridia bacterium]|nr:metallophosphoesterase [Clostridia bacterium]
MKPLEFATVPTVYAVGKNYQIMVPVTCETVMWVRVGDRNFYDDSNGILRSACTTHRMTVPMELLDEVQTYTVCYRTVFDRKPYFAELSDVMEYTSSFRPVRSDGAIRIYHIADAHNRVAEPVAAGKYFGEKLDLLVLNGDIPNHSGKIEYFTAIHEIAAQITNGEIPVIFSRGNHDTRGIFAEKIEEHVPTDMGRSYYTFRLGRLWGMVLDCGEDKSDDHTEYGHTICCEDFRRRETDFIRNVIASAATEYEADGVENRIVICHNPFTQTLKPPFDIEQETYTEWSRLLREHVKPQIMLCGHIHKCYVSPVGGELDHKGQPCPVIVASKATDNVFMGGAVELYTDRCNVKFTDNLGVAKDEIEILF